MLRLARRTLYFQLVATSLAGLLASGLGDVWQGLSVAYGGLVSVANSALLAWRWKQGGRHIHSDPGKHLRSFIRSFIERFFVVGILLAIGFAVSRLDSIALLAGFVIGQSAILAANLTLHERT